MVEGRNIEPAGEGKGIEHVATRYPAALAIRAQGSGEIGYQHLAFTRGDDIGKERERLRIHERDRAANHHERVALVARRGPWRQSSQPQHRDHVRVVPLERDREGQHVEIANGSLRFERHQRCARRQLRLQFLLRRQEHSLTHHVVQVVEQAVDSLESQAGHADVVGIRKCQRDAQTAAVRLRHEADFTRESLSRALAGRLPFLHVEVRPGNCVAARRRVTR